MKMIVFVGEKTAGYFAEEVAKVRGFDFAYVAAKGNIEAQTNDILFQTKDQNCQYLLFDVDQYIDPAEVIADEMKKVAAATNAKPIAFVPAFLPNSAMCRALVDRDIKSFITAGTSTEMKDQLEKNIAGFYEGNERRELQNLYQVQEEERRLMEFKTVGVSGVCHRIGTTTQAIQIVKYLQMKGYTACYVELNSNTYREDGREKKHQKAPGYVEKTASWFVPDQIDEELGKVTCYSVDMFYMQAKIGEVQKQGYDYYVYDYGMYTDPDFNKTAFVREDVKIFVCGAKPTELDDTEDVAQSPFYEDARLLFTFIPPADREDVCDLMEEIKIAGTQRGSGNRTYFTQYTPDPFQLSELEPYETMIPVEEIVPEDVGHRKKKRSLLGRKKKNK